MLLSYPFYRSLEHLVIAVNLWPESSLIPRRSTESVLFILLSPLWTRLAEGSRLWRARRRLVLGHFFVFIGCKSSFLDTSVTQTCFPSLMFSFIVDRYSYCCYSFSGKSPICWFLLKAAVCSGVHKGCIPRLA